MDNILMALFALLAVVSITFVIWLCYNLIDVAAERDEWRERAVSVNADSQEKEVIKYYEDIICNHRDYKLRPYRSNTRVSPNKDDSALQTLLKGE